MRSRYRERLKAIRHCPLFGVSLGATALAVGSLEHSVPAQIAGGALFLGGFAAYCFWTIYLNAHPKFSGRQRGLLLVLYALGVVAFLSMVGVAVWSIAGRHGGLFHWLVVGIGIVDNGEHFAVRWIDGTGRWRVFGSPRHWLGGAAGVALRRRCTNLLWG